MNHDRHELAVDFPVRIVYRQGEPLFCGHDLAALFGYKNTKCYDAVVNAFGKENELERILVPSKQSPQYCSMRMIFLNERQAREFIGKKLAQRGVMVYDGAVDDFIDALKLGRIPSLDLTGTREEPRRNARLFTGYAPGRAGSRADSDACKSLDKTRAMLDLCRQFMSDVGELMGS